MTRPPTACPRTPSLGPAPTSRRNMASFPISHEVFEIYRGYMSKMILKAGLGLLVLAGMTLPLTAAVPVNKTLRGHVPAVVSHLATVGSVPATNILHLAIGLELRN